MRGTHPERPLDELIRRALPVTPGGRMLVACSGGPDSVALASVIARIAAAKECTAALGHVNHGIRPSASQDEAVALSAGARLGLEVHVAAVQARSDEASLRDARYDALLELARRSGAAAVLTAHTAEDQAETVLLALFRGTGPQGLGGMPPSRPLGEGVDLVRPALRVGRAQLRAELYRAALPYALDPSNADPRYRRTRVREALALLRQDFPRLDEAIARCAELVRDEEAQNERADARRALRTVLDERGLLRDVPFERIEAALDVRQPGRRVFLKRGVEIVTERP